MITDIKVHEVQTFLVPAACRTPLSFGAVVVEELPIGYASATVENRAGEVATGWGAMFLMDLWAWPSSRASHEQKNKLMCDLLEAYAHAVTDGGDFAHPLAVFLDREEDLRRANRELCDRLTPGEEMPFLGALVAASPVDHALHDAFGNVNGMDSYLGYGPDHMSFDLSRYLGREFAAVYPSQFLREAYSPQIPIFHLVGGLDILRRTGVPEEHLEDGLPNSLEEWIERDGVFCLKVKLRGKDMDWDLERTIAVSQVYHDTRGATKQDLAESPFLTADFNEQCESPDYVTEYLGRLREQSPAAFSELLYIEQPTERDLLAHRWDMRGISDPKPVLVDESLTSVDDLRLAVELGWSGIALKSCKCLSSDLMLLCAAEQAGIPYAIQDLTNPSLALIESVGLAARTDPIKGVETNSRQFFPQANHLIGKAHSGLCEIRDGYARTASISGTGLGFQIEHMRGFTNYVQEADAVFRGARPDNE
jgi:L-alanine-DL-glutamate epimerase-like enolase superfamily enzyme